MANRLRSYAMDLYSALAPAQLFWKFTGIAPYTLERNLKSSKYVIRTSDKLLASTITILVVILNISNISQGVGSDSVSSISEMLKRISYNAAALSYVLTMYYYKEDVVKSIENLISANTEIERETNVPTCYYKTRRHVIWMILISVVIVLVALLIEVFYEDPGLKFPLMHYIYYYVYYTLTVSALTKLFFFLLEIKRKFCLINDHVFKLKLSRERRVMRKILDVHRLLRITSKTVNRIFQVVMMAKVTVTSMFVLVVVFKFASNSKLPVTYFKEMYTVWCVIHLMEVAVGIKLFVDVQREVRVLIIFSLVKKSAVYVCSSRFIIRVIVTIKYWSNLVYIHEGLYFTKSFVLQE